MSHQKDMDAEALPRRRNLRPRKKWDYVDPAPEKPVRTPRKPRKTRARISRRDVAAIPDADDDEWDEASADDESEVFATSRAAQFRQRHRELRMLSKQNKLRPSHRPPPPKKPRVRKVKKLLPEDVYNRELVPQPDAPVPKPHEPLSCNPNIPFLVIFLSTFADLFSDFPQALAPQDIEEGIITETPSESVELLFRRLLKLALNRKKEIEAGRYGSALSEAHALRNVFGLSNDFPPLNWKSKGNAFAELSADDRAHLLHVLATWTLQTSEQVRLAVKNMDEKATEPSIAHDDEGNHYYFLGFYPFIDSFERTRFRLYKETNRLLANCYWNPIASSSADVVQFLKLNYKEPEESEEKESKEEHESKEEPESTEEPEEPEEENKNEPEESKDEHEESKDEPEEEKEEEVAEEGENGEDEGKKTETEEPGEEVGEKAENGEEEAEKEEIEKETVSDKPEEQEEVNEVKVEIVDSVTQHFIDLAGFDILNTAPNRFTLPKKLVSHLLEQLPLIYQSEKAASERIQREAKRSSKRAEIMRHNAEILRGEGRYAGRTRRKRVDYSSFLRDVTGDGSDGDYADSDGSKSKRRLRSRGQDYAWNEPEPESRQQRHARLLNERTVRETI